jgi:pimeloyl-ACP methyl ester carboxylesterase
MNFKRTGNGEPLLLIHGLGGSIHSWDSIVKELAEQREVILIDLPGFGASPPLAGEVTIGTLADAVTIFLSKQDLLGIDAVGTSMGARLVLELVRRGGILGAVISLDPGGFWRGWEKHAFLATIKTSIALIRLLHPQVPKIINNKSGRKLLLLQFSARPEELQPEIVIQELNDYVNSNSFDELLYNLVYGEKQKGLPINSLSKPLIIGWGKKDRVCLPRQAKRAIEIFPDARLHWFEDCGHFPQWDKPKETVDLILKFTGWKVKEQNKIPKN